MDKQKIAQELVKVAKDLMAEEKLAGASYLLTAKNPDTAVKDVAKALSRWALKNRRLLDEVGYGEDDGVDIVIRPGDFSDVGDDELPFRLDVKVR